MDIGTYIVGFGGIGIIALFVFVAIKWDIKRHPNELNEYVNSTTAPYDPYNPAYNDIKYRGAIIGLVLGILVFGIDALARFPQVPQDNGVLIGLRVLYVLSIILNGYNLFRYKKRIKLRKEAQTKTEEVVFKK